MRAVINKMLVLIGACMSTQAWAESSVVHVPARAALGVYQGAGCTGAQRLPLFTQWLGRVPDQTLEFLSWQAFSEGVEWAVKCWARAGQKRVVFSIPMLPPSGATLADGAAGRFDSLFDRYARILVKHGYGDSILRIGWEFNGDWYPWQSGRDPQSWIAYWRRIVGIMRAVPGANFKFDWNPAGGWTKYRAEEAYPGDAYVDVIGLDFYNLAGKPGVTAQQQWQILMRSPHGLQWHRDFAAAHGKPLSFPEWGTGSKPDGTGGGDDPHFIESMARWIASNKVVYHDYWDYPDSLYNARLSDGQQPLSGEAFRRTYRRSEP